MGNGEGFIGPRVRVISDTAQEFQGAVYYLCGRYFQDSSAAGEQRLHRAVWLAYHRKILAGHHIHHIDGDRSNNQIENLLSLPGDEHNREHGFERREEIAAMGREHQHRTKEWHASAEGRDWHRKQYQATEAKLRSRFEAICSCCGGHFMAAESVKNSDVRYCSKACKAHARRKSGVDDVARICAQCGVEFTSNKYSARKKCEACFPSRRTRRLLFDSP